MCVYKHTNHLSNIHHISLNHLDRGSVKPRVLSDLGKRWGVYLDRRGETQIPSHRAPLMNTTFDHEKLSN